MSRFSFLVLLLLCFYSGNCEVPCTAVSLDEGDIIAISYDSTGSKIAIGAEDGTHCIMDTKSKRIICKFSASLSPGCILFANKGKCIISGGPDGYLKFWDINSGNKITSTREDRIFSMALNPDGAGFAVGGEGLRVRIYDVITKNKLYTLKTTRGQIHAMAYSRNGDRLALCDNDAIYIYNTDNYDNIATFVKNDYTITAITFADDNRYLIAGSDAGNVIIWDIAKNEIIKIFENHIGAIYCLAVRRDILIGAGTGEKVCIWNLTDNKIIDSVITDFQEINCIQFNPQKNEVAIGGNRKQMLILNMDNIDLGPNEVASREKLNMDNALNKDDLAKNKPPISAKEGVGLASTNLNNADSAVLKKSKKNEQEKENDNPGYPPHLKAVCRLQDPNNNGKLDAYETGALAIDISNEGKGIAYDLVLGINDNDNCDKVTFGKPSVIGQLLPNATTTVALPLILGANSTEDTCNVVIEVFEKNGFDLIPPLEYGLVIGGIQKPKLEILDYQFADADNNSIIEKAELVEITVYIQNMSPADAYDITVNVRTGPNVFIAQDSHVQYNFDVIGAGKIKDLKFVAFTNNRATEFPINIDIIDHNGGLITSVPLHLPFIKSGAEKPKARVTDNIILDDQWDISDFPDVLYYQATVYDGNESIIDNGSYKFTFRLYDKMSSIDPCWLESQYAGVKYGKIGIWLGLINQFTESCINTDSLWLGIQFENKAENPNRRLILVSHSNLQRSQVAQPTSFDDQNDSSQKQENRSSKIEEMNRPITKESKAEEHPNLNKKGKLFFIGKLFSMSHEYEEPGLMSESGNLYGFGSEIGYINQDIALSMDLFYAPAGSIDYDGGMFDENGNVVPLQIEGVKDEIFELRLTAGIPVILSGRTMFVPYGGVGFRNWVDKMSISEYGYDREISYFFSPLGGALEIKFNNTNWLATIGLEIDIFWAGIVKSSLGQVDAGDYYLSNAENKQKKGLGTKLSMGIVNINSNDSWGLELYVQHWEIEKSDISYVGATSKTFPFTSYEIDVMEPQNNTTEIGLVLEFRSSMNK